MTDKEIKEKARELAIKYCKDIDPHGKEVYNIGCEIACCEMAYWKEQQMIQRACNVHCNLCENHHVCKRVCDELINFKKAMEE